MITCFLYISGSAGFCQPWTGKTNIFCALPPTLIAFRGQETAWRRPCRPCHHPCHPYHPCRPYHPWGVGSPYLRVTGMIAKCGSKRIPFPDHACMAGIFTYIWLFIIPSSIPPKWHFEDDFPFPKVGYVSSLEDIYTYIWLSVYNGNGKIS